MKRGRPTAETIIVTVLAIIWIVGLSWQNHGLKTQVEAFRALVDTGLVAGESMPSVSLQTPDGTGQTPLWSGGALPTVIAFISTTCPYCERSLEPWESLHRDLSTLGITFRAISLDSALDTAAYRDQHDLAIPLYVVAEADRDKLRINRVPLTAVISSAGIVEASWVGEFDGGRADQLLSAIDSR